MQSFLALNIYIYLYYVIYLFIFVFSNKLNVSASTVPMVTAYYETEKTNTRDLDPKK